jgi:hypothetical protein
MLTTSTSLRFRRLAAGLAAAATAVAMVPAAASATTWFGSSLNHDPANAGASCVADDTVPSPLCTHVGSYYPGTSGRVKAPFNGTVTALRIRAEGPTSLRFHLVRVRNLSSDHRSGQAKVVATSRTLQAQGPSSTDLDNGVYPVETFAVHLNVHQGDEVAVDTTNNTAEYCSDGTPGQLTFNPPLQAGAGFRASTGVDDCLLLVQAVENHAH